MTAITKSWTNIADSAVDPDAPLLSSLAYAWRDNIIHVREWLGANYTAGAVQDHNHDGVNSALVETGPNLLRNGSFESGTSGWTFTDYTGGSHAISTSQHAHGAQSLAITSTVLANGGGDAQSNAYVPVAGGEIYPWSAHLWASVANVSSKLEVLWYNNVQALVSTGLLYSTSATPTVATPLKGSMIAPSAARYARLKFTGGVPATGTATGTVYFDGIMHGEHDVFGAGTIGCFGFSGLIPGWLKCNGAAISRTVYAALFSRIGTTFGVGDGSTTFNVPDLRGEFVRGWDDARGVDSGRSFGSAQADDLKSHTHAISGPTGAGYSRGHISYTGYPDTSGATGGTETRPRNIAMSYFIKY
ncbi:MAG: tail fiber protein [Pseudomonadota bacterium]